MVIVVELRHNVISISRRCYHTSFCNSYNISRLPYKFSIYVKIVKMLSLKSIEVKVKMLHIFDLDILNERILLLTRKLKDCENKEVIINYVDVLKRIQITCIV